jgi:hypothetical protein
MVQPCATTQIERTVSLRGTAGEAQEITSHGRKSGSDAGRLSEKNEDSDEKNAEVVFETPAAKGCSHLTEITQVRGELEQFITLLIRTTSSPIQSTSKMILL